MNPVTRFGLILLLLAFIGLYIWLSMRVFHYLKCRFQKSPKHYPADHTVALARVLRVIEIIAAQPTIDDDNIVIQLVDEGIDKVDAQLLVLFVPMGLGFARLKQLGVDQFPSLYAVSSNSGKTVLLPLAREHYFSAALALDWGQQSREMLQIVADRSAEMDAAHQALANGCKTLAGSRIGIPTIFAVTAEQITASRKTA